LLGAFSADANPPFISFLKSRHATVGSNTLVNADDGLGALRWYVADGDDFTSWGAQISAHAEANAADGDVPTRLVFWTAADSAAGGTEAMRINSAQNIGLGVAIDAAMTSSTWATVGLGGNGVLTSQRTAAAGNSVVLSSNAFFNGSDSWENVSNDESAYYSILNGTHTWTTAAAHATTPSFTTVMTIDSSGNVKNPIDSAGFYTGASDDFYMHHNGTDSWLESVTGILKINTSQTAGISLLYNGTENMVTAAGNGAVELYYDNVKKFETTIHGTTQTSVADGGWGFTMLNTNSSGQIIMALSDMTAYSPDDNSSIFWRCQDSTTTRLTVWADGDIVNHDNSYGATSDEKLKTDIEDVRSYWDDWQDIRFRKFRLKDDVEQYGPDCSMRFGVVAQELETVFPALVPEAKDEVYTTESRQAIDDDGELVWLDEEKTRPRMEEIQVVEDLGTTTKSVKYSVLSQIGLKVLQEAQARIETLEAQVAALQN